MRVMSVEAINQRLLDQQVLEAQARLEALRAELGIKPPESQPREIKGLHLVQLPRWMALEKARAAAQERERAAYSALLRATFAKDAPPPRAKRKSKRLNVAPNGTISTTVEGAGCR